MGYLLDLIQILDYLIPLLPHITLLHRRLLQLVSDMVDMPLQRENFLHIILLFLPQFGQVLGSATHFSFSRLHLLIEFTILFGDLVNCALKLVDILAGISVITEDIFFFDFDGSGSLLGLAFAIGQLMVLLAEEFIGAC